MKKQLTFMVVSHPSGRVKERRLSRPAFLVMASAAVLAFCALLSLAFGFVGSIDQRGKLVALQTENAALQRQLVVVKEEMETMRQHMDELIAKDRIMRAWVDLAEPRVRQIGIGGGDAIPPEWENAVSAEVSDQLIQTHTDMDQLLREARFLKASFDTILSVLGKDTKMRRHIPSITPVAAENPRISSGFGIRRDPFTGRRQFHNGIDYPGRIGTPIVATADGVIDKIDRNNRLGWYVAIAHGYGLRTVYGHLNRKPQIAVGDRVKRGQKIGEMGRTGRATASHLHYAVSKNGKAENPMNYIFDQKTGFLF